MEEYKELYYDTILNIAQHTKMPSGTAEFANQILKEYKAEDTHGLIMISLVCGMLMGEKFIIRD